MQRNGFLQQCNAWKEHTQSDSVLSDVMDGRVWKAFRFHNNRPFLAAPNNICFALNIDWFNPYEHTQYSIGAIYLTILNLPRDERYKIENTILVGLIPGPTEPKRINCFLNPLVDELLQLWAGITVSSENNTLTLRAMLLCFISDIPATRKVCGFPGFKARLGCSKCMKEFPCEGFGERTDYSGYDRTTWVMRSMEQHLHSTELVKNAKTPTEKTELQRTLGVGWSSLCRLPYFNIVKCHLVDPMHNLYLGTAKHMVKVWKEKGLIKQEHLHLIQVKIDELQVPYGVGRIPYKVGSNFAGLTADQWMNWTNLYSIHALADILPPKDLECWSFFVQASVLLRQYTISLSDLAKADEKLLEFCRCFEACYGKEYCTPNMHLHAHIKDCILDFGPISAFWAYPFERFNGILESFSKNWIKPEEQITKKFLSFQELMTMKNIPEFSDFASLCTQEDSGGSLLHTNCNPYMLSSYKKNITCEVYYINSECLDLHEPCGKVVEKYFCDNDIENLTQMYSIILPELNISHVPRKHLLFSDLQVLSEHYVSIRSRSQRSPAIMAYWGNPSPHGLPVKFGLVEYYFLHSVALSESNTSTRHLFAKVKWYQDHYRPFHFHSPLRLVCTLFEPDNKYSFIPVSRFLCRCAISPKVTLKFDYGSDTAFVVSPYFICHANL